MYKKIFISFLIVAFFNLVMSCSSSEKISMEELYYESEKIIEIVLINAEVIKFDDQGGKLESVEDKIMGTTNQGQKIFTSITKVSKLGLIDNSRSDSVYWVELEKFFEIIKDHEQNVSNADIVISEVIFNSL